MALAVTLPNRSHALPYLDENSARSSPIAVEELHAFLAAYAEGAREITPSDLTFVRTAQIEDKKYWLWRFETIGGGVTYATVLQEPDGSAWMAHHSGWQPRTSEEVLLDDYHNA